MTKQPGGAKGWTGAGAKGGTGARPQARGARACELAGRTNRNDKAQEFFAKQATELQNQAEWKDWFVLPFLPSPDTNPAFATYFSRQWADTFIVSLHNFLSVLFQCMHILSAAWGCGPV
ncbi:hypothetical protein HPG69_019388 [Diceros bicornis minor]|uniref:ARMC9 CTLH-like domain-containing protein n=1 Tax=Diceros bicornis minor TaxID=77932 RepID=A0A7J7E9G8_DICBM|nr:hypothetical protein HPG69_019388 [Diceros bicornis minor]